MTRLPAVLQTAFARVGRRWRLLACAMALGIAAGLIGVPEGSLRNLKAVVRQHRVPAHEVIVAIDDKTLSAVGEYPFPRSLYARVIANAFAHGANRVFLDLNFSTAQSAKEDAALGAELARHPGKVFIGAPFVSDPVTGRMTVPLPPRVISDHASVVNSNMLVTIFGDVSRLPFGVSVDGVDYPSFPAVLSGHAGKPFSTFPLDTSISLDSFTTVSMVDLVENRTTSFQGSDIIIGATSDTLKDLYVVKPYQSFGIPSAYVLALGAETLREQWPVDLGWVPACVVAVLLSLIALTTRRDTQSIAIILGSILCLLTLPIMLPTALMASVLPGVIVLAVLALLEARRLVTEAMQARATTNQVSGLLNLTALRILPARPDDRLVVGRIHNFAEVISALPADAEAALIAQIASRLQLGTSEAELYHGDNGVFAWFARDPIAVVGERLDALHALFRSAVTIAGGNVDLVVTFGVDDGRDRSIANRLGSALVAAAEAAADGAKWREFDNAKLADAAWKLSLLSQLDAAIDEGDLWVAYQPKLDLATRQIVGAEALVRWTHPDKGAISPIEFVAAAEQHNRIEKLTQHVLNRAVLAAATINAHEIAFSMAVNLSVRLLESRDIVAMVADALASHRLEPGKLTLEITETAALAGGNSLAVLNELRGLGVLISIDDYGTGLSTLDYLKKIPASEIKIDRSFVQAMLTSSSDLLMINSTIQLAHSLGHCVVAEGVETDEAIARLADLGCDIAQGYRIGRPMTFQDLARRILAERKHAA